MTPVAIALIVVNFFVLVGFFIAAKVNYDLNDRWDWTWDNELYWHRRVAQEMRRTRSDSYYR